MPTSQPKQPNEALRAVLRESGLSYELLARRVRTIAAENGDRSLRTNSAAVTQWVKGTPPQPSTAAYVTEALSRKLGRLVTLAEIGLPSTEDADTSLSLAQDPVASLAHLGRADVDRRRFLSTTVYSVGALTLPLAAGAAEATQRAEAAGAGRASGQADVDTVREVTSVFSRADERLGGNNGRSAVVEYLSTDVATYLNGTFANDAVRRGMFSAAAELAYLAGWKAHDAGRDGLAQRYYLHAFQMTQESDPRAHAGYILRIMAHQAFDLGHHAHCVDLAEAALKRVRGQVDAGTETLFWLTLARAHAAEGDGRRALGAISKAEHLMSIVRTGEPPMWAVMGGSAEARASNQTAKALTQLGDMTAAAEQYQRSAQCWDPKRFPRIYALTLADLGQTQLARGHIDTACGTWSTALDHMGGMASARVRTAVGDIRSQLAVFRGRNATDARKLDERAAQWQAATA
ncbi:hypothetical protein ABZW18_21200 [Streptomyces sp. NPDC004647]|uniref:hypothetical protein n=1 Tax=Streptomyces sp. NPDC004647 TaxID=3154671 RepID=UPI0033AFCFEE